MAGDTARNEGFWKGKIEAELGNVKTQVQANKRSVGKLHQRDDNTASQLTALEGKVNAVEDLKETARQHSDWIAGAKVRWEAQKELNDDRGNEMAALKKQVDGIGQEVTKAVTKATLIGSVSAAVLGGLIALAVNLLSK